MSTLAYTYHDAYLAPLITAERETRASAEVAELGTLPAQWVERLTVLRCYIITCLECQRAPDDVFSAKLAAYRAEETQQRTAARAAQAAAAADEPQAGGVGTGGFFSVRLERA